MPWPCHRGRVHGRALLQTESSAWIAAPRPAAPPPSCPHDRVQRPCLLHATMETAAKRDDASALGEILSPAADAGQRPLAASQNRWELAKSWAGLTLGRRVLVIGVGQLRKREGPRREEGVAGVPSMQSLKSCAVPMPCPPARHAALSARPRFMAAPPCVFSLLPARSPRRKAPGAQHPAPLPAAPSWPSRLLQTGRPPPSGAAAAPPQPCRAQQQRHETHGVTEGWDGMRWQQRHRLRAGSPAAT